MSTAGKNGFHTLRRHRQPNTGHAVSHVPEPEALGNIQSATTQLASVLLYTHSGFSRSITILSRERTNLSIVGFAGGKQSLKRVVARDNEAGNIDEEGTAKIEDDEEQVDGAKAEDSIDFGNRGLPLKVGEAWIFGQLRRILSASSHMATKMACTWQLEMEYSVGDI